MELTPEHKKDVEIKLVEIVADALEHGKLSSDEATQASQFILDRIDEVNTQEELLIFLEELSSLWDVFGHLFVTEQGKIKEKQEDVTAREVETLVEKGNIDEALSVAKKATDST